MPPKKKTENLGKISPKSVKKKSLSPPRKIYNYPKLTVVELKEILKERGIKDSDIKKEGKTVKKEERIKALEDYDKKNKPKKASQQKKPSPKKVVSDVSIKGKDTGQDEFASGEDTEEMSESEIQELLRKQKLENEKKKVATSLKKSSLKKSSLKKSPSNFFIKNKVYKTTIYGKHHPGSKRTFPLAEFVSSDKIKTIRAAIFHLAKNIPSEFEGKQITTNLIEVLEKENVININNSSLITAISVCNTYSDL
jgi:hypothetical protein